MNSVNKLDQVLNPDNILSESKVTLRQSAEAAQSSNDDELLDK